MKTNFTLEKSERAFVCDTVRNAIFDLREDDEDKWFMLLDELKLVLDIFGETIDDDFDEAEGYRAEEDDDSQESDDD